MVVHSSFPSCGSLPLEKQQPLLLSLGLLSLTPCDSDPISLKKKRVVFLSRAGTPASSYSYAAGTLTHSDSGSGVPIQLGPLSFSHYSKCQRFGCQGSRSNRECLFFFSCSVPSSDTSLRKREQRISIISQDGRQMLFPLSIGAPRSLAFRLQRASLLSTIRWKHPSVCSSSSGLRNDSSPALLALVEMMLLLFPISLGSSLLPFLFPLPGAIELVSLPVDCFVSLMLNVYFC